jgi:hypothetical protein
MAAFWAEMGVAYLEINKLPCLHEIDIPKSGADPGFQVRGAYLKKLRRGRHFDK